MKFVELNKKLKEKIDFSYAFVGKDVFLKQKSVEMLKATLALALPEMNLTELNSPNDVFDIVSACEVVPFVDTKRLVVVKDFSLKKEADKKIISKYLENPVESTILVFLAEDISSFDSIKSSVNVVDCNELDLSVAIKWIQITAKNQNIKISVETAEKLFHFCAGKMLRISTELDKLISFAKNKGEIFDDDVELMVSPENDFNIFQITDEIARRNKEKACEMMFGLFKNDKNAFSIVKPLYGHFRRLLFVKISKLSNKELAKELQVKEYAILMAQKQSKNFSATELKKYIDMLVKIDYDIKNGKISEENAIKTLTINILQTRG